MWKKAIENDALVHKWKSLCKSWKSGRQEENIKGGNVLRPLSDSLLIYAQTNDQHNFHVIDNIGNYHSSPNVIIAGSGSYLIHESIKMHKIELPAHDSEFSDCIDFIEYCCKVGSCDLYVTGIPTIVQIKENRILDLTGNCQERWENIYHQYFEEIKG